ncbi:MAG: gliding motility-associated C-terminal domain-containing protein [Sphingobacteriaceae bacterium]|nr:MAG: gliding motility-associated C-terminal domain-containing protein [Sphingobacteriaceae bacterium]
MFTWYRNATLTDVAFVGSTFTTPVLTTSTTYYVTVSGDNKCENSPADAKAISIIINPSATAADINLSGISTICSGSTVSLTASSTTVTNPIFTWYRNASLTDVAFVGSVFTSPALTQNTTYYVTVKGDNKCENTAGNALSITITVNPGAQASDIVINGNTEICKDTNTILTASSTTINNPIFTWYNDAALTDIAFTGAAFSTPILSSTKTYYVTVKGDNKCESSGVNAAQITVTVKEYALASDITVSDAVICSGSQTTLNASSFTVTNPIFTWYSDASLTVVAYVGPTFIVPSLTATTSYYVTVKGTNRCENTPANAKVVTITVNALAGMTDIILNGNATACAGSSAQFTATSATVNNPVFSWYADAALSNLVFIGPSFTSAPLFINTTFYVTVKGDNKCENSPANAKVVQVTISPIATANDITVANQSICEGSRATLVASTTTVTDPIFTWYTDAALTTVAFSGATFITPILNSNTNYYVTVKGSNKCENSAATAKVVSVAVNEGAKQADIVLSTPSLICGSGSVTINASSLTVSNPVFTWYSDASLTAPVFVGPAFTTPTLTSSTTYYVTVKGSNKCENTAANAKPITINVNPIAIANEFVVNGNTTICGNNTTTLTASSTVVTTPVFTWYSDAALTSPVFVGAVFTTPNLAVSTTYYVTVKGSNRCENTSATAKAVLITVNPTPADPTIASTGRNICAGQSTTLIINNPVNGVNYEWYTAATNGTAVFVGSSFTTPILNANTTYYVQAIGTGGCSNTGGRIAVQVTVTPQPLAPAVSSNNISVCIGNSTILTISNPVANVIYNWYTTATGGTPVGNGTSFTTPIITANVTYYAEAVSGSCQSSTRTPVAITALPVPLAPLSLSATTNPICAGGTTIISVNNPDPNLNYRWYASSSGGTMLAEGSSFTTPTITTTTTYYVESVSKTGGCSSINRTSITVNVLPVLVAPTVIVGSVTTNSVTFTWNAINGASGYEVSTNNGVNWSVSNGGTSHTILGLQPGESVTIIVRAMGASSCQTSANSNAVTATTNDPFKDELYIPNTFTPNNDGRNDFFLAYGNNVAKFRMRVYNQWGEFVFESQNILQGWDGTYRGRQQPTGVYVYYVDATFNSGAVKTFKGTVTLLR